jgi:hypothetical protein
MCDQKTLKSWLRRYHASKLDFTETLKLFSYLIRTGEVETQEPTVQICAAHLVNMGLIGLDGVIQAIVTDPETAVLGQG